MSRRVGRWVARIAIALAFLILAVVIALVMVLWYAPVSERVLESVRSRYAASIPGTIEWEVIEGSLGGGLSIEGISLRDAADRPLVEARSLRVRVRPLPLLLGTLRVEHLVIDGGRVHLDPNASWRDLGPTRERAPPDEQPWQGLAPGLPFEIRGHPELHDVHVVQHRPEGTSTLVRVDALELTAALGDGWIEVTDLEASGAVPPAQLRVSRLGAERATWRGNELDVPSLFARTSPGTLALAGVRLRFAEWTGAVEMLAARLDPAWLEERGLPDAAIYVHATGSGGKRGVDAEMTLGSTSGLAAHLRVDAAFEPGRSVLAVLDASLPVDAAAGPARRHVRGAFGLAGTQQLGTAWLGLACENCDAPLRVGAVAAGALMRGEGGFAIAATGSERSTFEAVGAVTARRAWASAVLDAPDLRAIERALGEWTRAPRLAGGVRASALCAVERAETPRGLCRVDAQLRKVEPVQRLKLGAWVALGDRPAVMVDHLEAKIDRFEVRTRAAPMLIVASPEAVLVEGVDLWVVDGKKRGRVFARGRWAERGEHDLQIGARRFELSILQPFLTNAPALAGTFALDLRLQGAVNRPRIALAASARSLRIDATDWGRIEVDAGYEDERIGGSLRWQSPRGSVRARARLPIVIDLEQREVRTKPGPIAATLAVRDVDLARLRDGLGKWSEHWPQLGGMVELDAEVEGTRDRPRIGVALDVEDARIDELALGRIRVDLEHAQRRADIVLTGRGRDLGRVRATAEVPLDLDLRRFRARWRSGAPHRANVDVEGLHLRGLQRIDPRLQVDGRLTLRLRAEGNANDPKFDVQVRTTDLRYRAQSIGRLELTLVHREGPSVATLSLDGPLADRLRVHAELPLHLRHRKLDWAKHSPHRVDVELREADVAGIVALFRADPPVAGRLSGHARLRGTADAPIANVDLRLRGAAVQQRDAGELELRASYGQARLVCSRLSWTKGRRERLSLVARLPVEVSLGARGVRWDAHASHAFDLQLSDLDDEGLSELVGLPDSADFLLGGRILGEGSVDEFRIEGDIHGLVGKEYADTTPVVLRIEADAHRQQLQAKLGPQGPLVADLDVQTHGSPARIFDGVDDVKDTAFEAHLRTPAIDLARLDPLMPGAVHALAGTLKLQLDGEGTFAQPRFRGYLRLKDAAATVVAARQRFEDIELDLRLNERQLRLETLQLRASGGRMRGRGEATIAEGPRVSANIGLVAEQVPVRQPGLPYMFVDLDTSTQLQWSDERRSIEVRVNAAELDVRSQKVPAPERIPENENVQVLRASGPPDGQESEPRGTPLTIAVQIEQPVRVRGPNVEMDWDGGVSVTTGINGPRGEGALQLDKGSFILFGNEFEIERGTVTLVDGGEITPYVDLIARTEMPEAEVTVKVYGRLPRPELRFESNPAMPETQIFALLVTGTTGEDQPDAEEMQAKAASLLAAFANPALTRQLNRTLGIDRAGLAFGESTSEPILFLGKNLGQDVYVETRYHHNAAENENRAELRLEYDITRRWLLETFFGDAAKGGIDIFWHHRFDGPEQSKR